MSLTSGNDDLPADPHAYRPRFLDASTAPEAVGHEQRLAEVVQRHHGLVWRTLRRMGASPPDADDATQHVFWTFSQRASEVEPGQEAPFLVAVAVKVAANVRRLVERRREIPTDEPEVVSAESPETLLQQKQLRQELDRGLSTLLPEQRAIFVLFEIEGFSLPEIAESLPRHRNISAAQSARPSRDLAASTARRRTFMTEIKRLLQARPGSRLSAMVQAAADEQPPARLPGRILAGLGVGATVTGTTAVASGSAVAVMGKSAVASSSWALGGLAGKWLAIGAVGGVMATAGLDAVLSAGDPPTERQAPATPPARAVVPKAASALPKPLPERRSTEAELPVEPTPAASPQSLRPALPVAGASSDANRARLREEVRIIDAARAALAAGKPDQALQQLAAYESIAGTKTLNREARVLQIEALVQSGDLQRARALEKAYSAAFPGDAHARRLRALSSSGAGGSIGQFADMSQAERQK